ncbi:nudA [Symbiodinium sp. CCMP2592]|nr:nudA [Symbiodinium sp. CCMP2592]
MITARLALVPDGSPRSVELFRLRDKLGAAKTATEMFRVFSRFNALFVRPRIRRAIQEYQSSLIQQVKGEGGRARRSSRRPMRAPRSESIASQRAWWPPSFWRQLERLAIYMSRVEDSKKFDVSMRIFDIQQGYQTYLLLVNFDEQIITLFKEARATSVAIQLAPTRAARPFGGFGYARLCSGFFAYAMFARSALNTACSALVGRSQPCLSGHTSTWSLFSLTFVTAVVEDSAAALNASTCPWQDKTIEDSGLLRSLNLILCLFVVYWPAQLLSPATWFRVWSACDAREHAVMGVSVLVWVTSRSLYMYFAPHFRCSLLPAEHS